MRSLKDGDRRFAMRARRNTSQSEYSLKTEHGIFKAAASILQREYGFSMVELVTVAAIMVVTLGAIFSLVPSIFRTSTEVQKRFVAENRGRATAEYLEKVLREGERLGASGYQLIYADPQGYSVDVRHDDKIVRFWLDTTNKQVKEFVDAPSGGLYNYQVSGGGDYSYYVDPPNDADWDEVRVIGEMVVNSPSDSDQVPATDPDSDERLFIFYGQDFDTPLDSNTAGWMNEIRGVGLYLKVDKDTTDAYEAAGLRTHVNIRSLSFE